MQKKAIPHPFHPISFEYDENKPWTARDEKLLNHYIALHDHEAQRQQEATALENDFTELKKQTEALRSELNVVKARLSATSETADQLMAQVKLQVPNALNDSRIQSTKQMIRSMPMMARCASYVLN